MTMKKIILGAIAVGCLSIGASFAAGTTPDPTTAPTDAQKAKLEELKAKLEAQRAAMKAKHDSLAAANKDEIEKRMAERKAEMEKAKAAMDSVRAQVKALIDSYKDKIKAASDSDKAALAKELAAKLKALTADLQKEMRAKFEAGHAGHDSDMTARRAEIEKRLQDAKAAFDAHKKEIDAQRAEWLKNHPEDSSHVGGGAPRGE